MKESKEELQRELLELSPLLAQWKAEEREEGFEVPAGYFRRLPDEALARIRQDERAGEGWIARGLAAIAWLLQPRYVVAGLATVAVLIVAGLAYLGLTRPRDADPFAGLSAEEIGRYIDANLEKFDEHLVIEASLRTPGVSILPAPIIGGDTLNDDYIEELLRDLNTESIEEFL